jgi:RNA polymerase-binding transcription factor DksA
MQIQDLRERLTQRRDELRVRVKRVCTDLRRETDPLVSDFADQAVQRANDDVLGAIRHSAEDELAQIDVALRRIEERRYDTCAGCGGRIGVERLAAVPYTDRCATCATAGGEAR